MPTCLTLDELEEAVGRAARRRGIKSEPRTDDAQAGFEKQREAMPSSPDDRSTREDDTTPPSRYATTPATRSSRSSMWDSPTMQTRKSQGEGTSAGKTRVHESNQGGRGSAQRSPRADRRELLGETRRASGGRRAHGKREEHVDTPYERTRAPLLRYRARLRRGSFGQARRVTRPKPRRSGVPIPRATAFRRNRARGCGVRACQPRP